jgi:hypothetical protein
LTSQINLNGDKYLWDDFAFATRDGLIADPVKVTDRELIQQRELDGEHTEVRFDFTCVKRLTPMKNSAVPACAHRVMPRVNSAPGPGPAREYAKFRILSFSIPELCRRADSCKKSRY